MAIDKERIDALLVEQGWFDSREKAKAAVMAGIVFIGQDRMEKPGFKVPRTVVLHVKGAPHPYVSRGGLKLEKAIQTFSLDLNGCIMLDIGASTGGFTDCALRHGASYVYAIDVGYNQLDWSLRNHPQVNVMERVNFRYIEPKDLTGPQPNFASVDVSFISLALIFPPMKAVLEQGECVTLIKPQFEAGRDKVGKSGVVRSPEIHQEVLQKVVSIATEAGFYLKGMTYSPITGSEGNIEFLAYWTTDQGDPKTMVPVEIESSIEMIVDEARQALTAK